MNDREDLAHRLVDKVMEKKRDAKNKTLGMAKKSAFGDTPNRIRKAMGKTPAIKSPALNVSSITFFRTGRLILLILESTGQIHKQAWYWHQ